MGEADFDRIIDAVRNEIARVPAQDFSNGLWASGERAKAADDKRRARRYASPMARVRRVGEGRKRYR